MLLEEIMATKACDLSPHGHAFINPYNGCSMGCPFCYWLSQEGWENRIQVKMNIGELLEKELETWAKDEFIYLGSVCDPFNELEGQYRLSKCCLELLRKYEVPLVITTSAATPVILDYVEIFRTMRQRVVIVVELARLPFIDEMNRGGVHQGIVRANALCEAGLEIWATLAPILPEITDLERVLGALDSRIPVYVDSLNCDLQGIQGSRMMEWIRREHGDIARGYEAMIANQDWSYLERILKDNSGNERVKTFPFQL